MRQATRRLDAAGLAGAGTDARLLLCAATGLARATLLLDAARPLAPDEATRLDAFLIRRIGREPVSRILGRRAFWGHELAVTPDVLDPRPDTETLVEAGLDHLADAGQAWRLLDLGTGSGAILCALLSERPAALGLGIDRSAAACRVARRNLVRCGLDTRCLIIEGDWGAAAASGRFDLVVSNPPYIESGIIPSLDADVREHDPLIALDGGPDGLDAYRALVPTFAGLLAPGGVAMVEVGAGQAPAVSALLRAAGFRQVSVRADLSGHDRVVTARR